jgi:predicted N-formylglutamate amidohydrolase
MAGTLDATLIHQNFSRLVIDCNRAPDSPDSMKAVSEIHAVPGNADISEAERAARIAEIYVPFHDRIEGEIAKRLARGSKPVIVTMHSFTPVFHGWTREVELGILHDEDARLSDAILAVSGRYTDMVTRRNEPYGPGEGVMHTVDRHAVPHDLLNVMIEVRNDLIARKDDQERVAHELVGMIRDALGHHPEKSSGADSQASGVVN